MMREGHMAQIDLLLTEKKVEVIKKENLLERIAEAEAIVKEEEEILTIKEAKMIENQDMNRLDLKVLMIEERWMTVDLPEEILRGATKEEDRTEVEVMKEVLQGIKTAIIDLIRIKDLETTMIDHLSDQNSSTDHKVIENLIEMIVILAEEAMIDSVETIEEIEVEIVEDLIALEIEDQEVATEEVVAVIEVSEAVVAEASEEETMLTMMSLFLIHIQIQKLKKLLKHFSLLHMVTNLIPHLMGVVLTITNMAVVAIKREQIANNEFLMRS
jgi:hypothetical protein